MNWSELLQLAKNAVRELGKPWDERLEVILRFCWQSPDQKSFPKIRNQDFKSNASKYMAKYAKAYFAAKEGSLLLQEVATVADPAIDVILKAFSGLDNLPLVSKHHRQSMAAENLLGLLLERYIAEHLEPKGWIWCAGNTVRSIDFIREDLSIVLQVKNRSNSENSSSAAIRQGTEIEKWYRIDAKTGETQWHTFPLAEGLTEEGFYRYIEAYANRIK